MSKTMRITVEFGDFEEKGNPPEFIPRVGSTQVYITAFEGDKLSDEYSATFLCDRGRAAVKEALIQRGEIQ